MQSVSFKIRATMSKEEIFNIITHLHKLDCPTELLGCNPEKILDGEKNTITEVAHNLLIQDSNERYELLKWIDARIFQKAATQGINAIEERLSLLISNEAGSFFSPVSQVSLN